MACQVRTNHRWIVNSAAAFSGKLSARSQPPRLPRVEEKWLPHSSAEAEIFPPPVPTCLLLALPSPPSPFWLFRRVQGLHLHPPTHAVLTGSCSRNQALWTAVQPGGREYDLWESQNLKKCSWAPYRSWFSRPLLRTLLDRSHYTILLGKGWWERPKGPGQRINPPNSFTEMSAEHTHRSIRQWTWHSKRHVIFPLYALKMLVLIDRR